MTEKERLLKEKSEGDALGGLKTHHGYKVLIGLFKEIYMDNVENLITAEDEKARNKINALDEILEMIDRSISMGEMAKQELTKERFK